MFISQSNKQALRNPWVLGWIGLLFFVVFIDVIFIVTAVNTTPGLVEKDYYEKGRDVEKNFLKKQQAYNRLGWHINLTVPEHVVIGQDYNFSINVVDADGMPLRDATLKMQAYRPSDASADINAKMEPVSDGVYSSRINLPLKGIWDIKIVVQKGEDELEYSRRINAHTP